ncbi:hypothetical protein [Kamptonema formosum]|nr:hypothetical protein [Oscillatoria sp. PCC 10802]
MPLYWVLGKPPATWRNTPAAGAPSEPAGGGRLLMYSAGKYAIFCGR